MFMFHVGGESHILGNLDALVWLAGCVHLLKHGIEHGVEESFCRILIVYTMSGI